MVKVLSCLKQLFSIFFMVARKFQLQPYHRTQPSTIQAIKDEYMMKTASMAYTDVFESAGGIKSMSKEPCNKTQVYNARKNSKESNVQSKDDLLELLKQHQSNESRGFLNWFYSMCCASLSEAAIAIDNVVMFCCQSSFSVFGIDATYV